MKRSSQQLNRKRRSRRRPEVRLSSINTEGANLSTVDQDSASVVRPPAIDPTVTTPPSTIHPSAETPLSIIGRQRSITPSALEDRDRQSLEPPIPHTASDDSDIPPATQEDLRDITFESNKLRETHQRFIQDDSNGSSERQTRSLRGHSARHPQTEEPAVLRDFYNDNEFIGDFLRSMESEDLDMFNTDALKFLEDTPDYCNDASEDDSLSDNNDPSSVSVEDEPNMKKLKLVKRKFFRTFANSYLIGITSLYGKPRYTMDQYSHLVAIVKNFERLPSPTTMRLRLLPYLIKSLFVPSKKVACPSKKGLTGTVTLSQALGSSSTSLISDHRNEAVLVLPSDWAKLDIRSIHVLREIVCLDRCRCCSLHSTRVSNDIRIESTARIRDKREHEALPFSLWVNQQGVPTSATLGSRLSIHTFSDQFFSEKVKQLTWLTMRQKKYRGEVCNFFNATLISTYSVSHNLEKRTHLVPGLQLSRENGSMGPLIRKCVTFLLSLSSDKIVSTQDMSDSDSCTDASSDSYDEPSRPRKKTRRASASRRTINERPSRSEEDDNVNVRPGDIISFLYLTPSSRTNIIVAHISRFWPTRLEDDRQLLLFMWIGEDFQIKSMSLPSFGVPELVSLGKNCDSNREHQNSECLTKGTLSNGEQFYMYRLLMYADDFNPRANLFPRGSVGGVYMSPAGLHIRSRRSQASIRTLSLTPPGVSTNFILDKIIDDLVEGSIIGFSCIDAFGAKVRCFIEVVGYLADYPASSAALDVTGHNSFAPCTHCTFFPAALCSHRSTVSLLL